MIRTAIIIAIAAVPCSAAARTLTPHDLVMLDRITDPHLSPDGKVVAYDLRSTDVTGNTAVHSVWTACTSCENGPNG